MPGTFATAAVALALGALGGGIAATHPRDVAPLGPPGRGYLRTSGPGITVVERAAARGAPDMVPVIARDMPDGAIVRTVRAGTAAEVRGPDDRLDDLVAVAASLRPVAP